MSRFDLTTHLQTMDHSRSDFAFPCVHFFFTHLIFLFLFLQKHDKNNFLIAMFALCEYSDQVLQCCC